MIGVVCPSSFEYRGLARAGLNSRRAALVCSGMGKLRALGACHGLLRRHPKLRHVLLVGFAGGLSGLKVGDRIEPSVFIEQDYDARPFEKFPNLIRRRAKPLLAGSLDAAMLTQDRFLKENPYRNGPYAKRYPRLACDMESYAAALFARTTGVGFSVLKFVSDAADETADHDFLKACRQLAPKLNASVRAALRALDSGILEARGKRR